MCGIAGYWGTQPAPELLQTFRSLVRAQEHRGPDDEGIAIYNGPSGFGANQPGVETVAGGTSFDAGLPTVLLGSRRLAILDRSSQGHQPMLSEDSRTAIVFNGEIYNYLELRDQLQAKGHRFRSGTDTEVLLLAYLEWGPACLDRLVGMFAFAVLDTRTGRLFAARDHLGVKPFYYTQTDSGIVFASEISPLLDWPGVTRAVDDQSLFDYLDRGYIDVGRSTIFHDVVALPAAHFLDVHLRNPTVFEPVRYWDPDRSSTFDMGREEAATRLRQLFLESVELQLRSDVPVGALLSGGTDSSAVVMAMRHVGGASLDIHTFSYIATHGAPSEERWIDIVNGAAKAVPHKLSLEPSEFMDDLSDLVQRQDEPFGSAAVHAQSRLFRLAAGTGVPVVLSGQGSDEMLGGYPDFWGSWAAALLRRGSVFEAAKFIGRVGKRYPPKLASMRMVGQTAIARALPSRVRTAAIKLRPTKPWIDHVWRRQAAVRGSIPLAHGRHVLRERLWFRLNVGFGDLLRFEDRSSMWASVEARVPFVSRPLIEFALSIPEDYFLGDDGEPKALFRQSMRGIVPDEVLERRERIGFAMPLRSWPGLLPDFRSLLEGAAQVPAVRSSTVDSYLTTIERGGDLPAPMVFPTWRLAGLGAWAHRFKPEFS